MHYTPQVWFCNCCGKDMSHTPPAAGYGGRFFGSVSYRVCSVECVIEMRWRDDLSSLGRPYEPKPARG